KSERETMAVPPRLALLAYIARNSGSLRHASTRPSLIQSATLRTAVPMGMIHAETLVRVTSWGRSSRFSYDQFRRYLILAAFRIGGARKLMQRVRRHLAEQVPMDVNRGDRRVAVFRQPRFVESGHRN